MEMMKKSIENMYSKGLKINEVCRLLQIKIKKLRKIMLDLDIYPNENDKEYSYFESAKAINAQLDAAFYLTDLVRLTGISKSRVNMICKMYDLKPCKKAYCITCGKEIHNIHEVGRKYCSNKCRKAKSKSNKEISAPKKETRKKRLRTCVICGTQFEGKTNSKFCSDKCKPYLKENKERKSSKVIKESKENKEPNKVTVEIGTTIGNWRVIGLEENDKKYNYNYVCECVICGFQRVIRKDKLLNSKQVKCEQCSTSENKINNQLNEKILQMLLNGQGATEISRELSITRDKVRYVQYQNQEQLKELSDRKKREYEVFKKKVEEKLHCKTKQQISNETDIPIHVINKIFKQYNLSLHGTGRCINCGKEHDTTNNVGRTRKYCSERCRELYKRKTSVTICRVCGRIIIGTGKDFCSEQCRKKREKKCVICGTSFYGFHTSKYCSDECKSIGKKKNYEKYKDKTIKRKCVICGTEFECKRSSPKTYCSTYCKNAAVANKVDATLLELFGSTNKENIRRKVKECLNEKNKRSDRR